MSPAAHEWLNPAKPAEPRTVTDPAERRALTLELVIVFSITLGLAGARSLLSLVDALLRPEPLNEQRVAINVPQATSETIDLFKQLLSVLQLAGWGALGVYLLWRAGMRLAEVGLDRSRPRRDLAWGAGLAALIGIPGLALYFVGWQLGFNLTVQPSTLGETWWRPLTLTLAAFGNSFAEEVLVVAYVLTRLRQLGWGENRSLLLAAVLRGSYHLYQGVGGFVGNLVMGLVFGRVWQRTNRLWPLVVAHTLLDVVAFVGYALLRDHVSWLP
ncbi:membrane protease YdiL (CAAX protease family) [Prauserella shujinwangii]|uniref:Membrane protease YdiL (CAAX protease family) n=1 Tax=Prauserella shujinwangii TaxID=1453103 RepID=A0A2T0LVJ3_9PSEU|nr:CPBP family intramembrane glutamic endopeptidase [Prauserella shujinwangii]PRX47870.1 membrane protease YdiL (CAAX protease family) [Prauserella shujinwangii]